MRSMEGFGSCINECGWMDLGFNGYKFTWERIDKFFCNSDWKMRNQDAYVLHLFSRKSDHRPIMLKRCVQKEVDKKKRPFRFMASWLMDSRFSEFIKEAWSGQERWSFAAASFTEEGMNSAMLMKLGWRLIEDKESLWARVLRAKYRCGDDLVPTVKRRVDSSCVWKSICGVWESVEKGIKWSLGDGAKMKFWKDNWIPNHPPLVKVVCHHLELRNFDEVVADYAKEGVWLIDRIRFWFGEEIVRKIVAIPTPRLGLERDRVVWGPTCDGKFSVSSAFNLGNENNTDGDSNFWQKIWKWPGPQKYKSFLWLLSRERIYTNLMSRGAGMIFFNCNMKQWVDMNLSRDLGKSDCGEWRLTFVVCAWRLWWRRNKLVFEDVKEDSRKIFWEVLFRTREISEAWKKVDVGSPQKGPKKEISVSWKPPEVGWTKINVDGSVSMDGCSAACGILARDCSGNWVKGFTFNIGDCSILEAELWGVFYGLDLAWRCGFERIIVEVDSRLACEFLSSSGDSSHVAVPIVARIKESLDRDWTVHVEHVFRETNMVVDALAKGGHSVPLGLCIFDELPEGLGSVLLEDQFGKTTLRVVGG
ncbi:putative ribonuclease H protein At1g65750 family [Senna tora]|uniref:Putative ribonuclease H protein At1g65750 family n=1 Tax=Senna tora TaxID=362788 RepID=A0A834SR80_9FABA|nr:putative ribonuclease H protein At1g65750 family [Senna tora]